MKGENKWKLLTIVFLLTTIVSASFAGYYGHKASEINEGLIKLELSKIGNKFLHIAPPEVFESYPYPYPIAAERIGRLKHQNLTENNTDAFLFQLYFWCGSIGHSLFDLGLYCSNSEQEELRQLKELIGWLEEPPCGLTGKYEAISRMTNKTWRKESLEELISSTKEDFRKIGRLLQDGKLSEAAKIAANGEALQYLDSPAYPIEGGIDKYEYKIGENVTFRLKNNWDRTIEVPAPPYVILKCEYVTTSSEQPASGQPPVAIVEMDNGSKTLIRKKIYEPTTTHVNHLKPGEKKEWIWNQKDANNTQVNEGDYKVVFSVDGWAEGTYSVSFWIENENKGNP